MRWQPFVGTVVVFTGVLAGATTSAVYVFVRPDWPLLVLAFAGLVVVVLTVVGGIGGPAVSAPETEEGAMGELHAGTSMVSGVRAVQASLQIGAYGAGLLLWSVVFIAVVAG